MIPSSLSNKTHFEANIGTTSSLSYASSYNSEDNDLDINIPSHLTTERLQVDRRKLNQMINTATDSEGVNDAERYFKQIMKTTDTFIIWPRNLKLGRKDPNVRIVGRPDNINWAKGLILANLATRGPKLKYTMTIANSDHPVIVGPGGHFVNRIMENTETSIQFHDTSRRKVVEKLNQVSVYGTFESLERARIALRLLTPLLISFELPVGTNYDSQNIKKLEVFYNVRVLFCTTQDPCRIKAYIKGYENEAGRVKEAARRLLDSMSGFMRSQTPATIQMEISRQFYDITTLSAIMEKTKTKIIYADAPKTKDEYTQVTITGSIDGVYAAKYEFISQLPLEMTFDIPENQCYIREIMSLEEKFEVSVTVEATQRDNTVPVTIIGSEKLIKNMHGAYQEILDMTNSPTNESKPPKAYLLVQPSFRQSLESELETDISQKDTIGIWAPTQADSECNFVQITPFVQSIGSDTAFDSSEQDHDEFRATPDSEASYEDGRRSCDWIVVKDAGGPAAEEEYPVVFDLESEDLEAAFILMTSPSNGTPHFMTSPGTDGW